MFKNLEDDFDTKERMNVCFLVDTSKHVSTCVNDVPPIIKKMLDALSTCKDSCVFETTIISFDEKVNVVQEFQEINDINVPTFSSQGDAYLSKALDVALQTINDKKIEYKSEGIDYYQPLLLIFTNGKDADEDLEVFEKVKKSANSRKLTTIVFTIGDNPNKELLYKITDKVGDIKFVDSFIEDYILFWGRPDGPSVPNKDGKIKLDIPDDDYFDLDL